MLPPLPPRPPARPQSLGDRIVDLQSLLASVDAEIAKFHAWIETARGHLDAGRFTPDEFEFHSAVLRRQIAGQELIRPGIVAQLAEARAAFAAQVAEGAAFDRWAAQRHAEALAGQPAPVAEQAPQMNSETEALALRAIACPNWRWMPGMRTTDENRVCYTWPDRAYAWDEYNNDCAVCDGGIIQLSTVCLPDLRDPATVGCLLALVRKAWDDEWLACKGEYSPDGPAWLVYSGKPHGRRFLTRVAGARYPTEAEALVAALEAAP